MSLLLILAPKMNEKSEEKKDILVRLEHVTLASTLICLTTMQDSKSVSILYILHSRFYNFNLKFESLITRNYVAD